MDGLSIYYVGFLHMIASLLARTDISRPSAHIRAGATGETKVLVFF
jgi:hypothetical protein